MRLRVTVRVTVRVRVRVRVRARVRVRVSGSAWLQSAPAKPGSQKHLARWQMPRPPHWRGPSPPGQGRVLAQSSPA